MSQFSLQSVNERKLAQPLWHTNNAKANKAGANASVYWVKPVHDIKGDIAAYNINNNDHMSQAIKNTNHTVHCVYQGEWMNNKKSGHGVQLFTNENNKLMKYTGEWSNNVRNGIGQLYKSDRVIKQHSNIQLNDYGVQWRLVYDGEWADDMKHGFGKYYYLNGDVYSGEWTHGLRSGIGEMTHMITGDVYTGAMENNTMNGVGRLNCANGDIYKGEHVNGVKHGAGVYYYASKGKLYVGEWSNGTAKCGSYCSVVEFVQSMKTGEDEQNEGIEWTTDNNIDISDMRDILIDAACNVGDVHISERMPRLRLAHPDNVITDTIEGMQSDDV